MRKKFVIFFCFLFICITVILSIFVIKYKNTVMFLVEKDGSITAVKVERGRHPELDKEALRVVRKIPKKFTPAKQNGKNVRYKFTLPVTFKLQ